MDSKELSEVYHRFFEACGHKRIPSSPLLPENDPTALFTSAGMQPLVPFLLGEPHPMGKRLVNVQRCLRTNDIEEVGDSSHLTFFEMLGNWSLGDYFKPESLAWSYEFLTMQLGMGPARLSVTVFAGDADAPRDNEAADVWRKLGVPDGRIHFLPKSDNWWGPIGNTGPCGPDSEVFYDTGRPDHPGCRPGCACGKWFEVWNNVFMEYNRTAEGKLVKLRQRNVDTGMGVERTVAVLCGYDDTYMIDTLHPLVQRLEQLSGRAYNDSPRAFRVIADHLRAASFAIADGAAPSNVEAGYVVRRLIRRAARHGRDLGIGQNFSPDLSEVVCNMYADAYPALAKHRERIEQELGREETRFKGTLDRGLGKYQKVAERLRQKGESRISGEEAFDLFETFGFPLELAVELAREQGLQVDEARFHTLYAEHRQISRRGMDKKFSGGLADQTEQTTRLHSATHLLHAALRQVLGPTVRQMGSNITPERLRFDFSYPVKLTRKQLQQVEAVVNEQIAQDLMVACDIMPLGQALAGGALAFFGEKYGDQVKVYSIGSFSREVCGGPHVTRTGQLGRFQITREESVGQGIRRIRAVLEGAD